MLEIGKTCNQFAAMPHIVTCCDVLSEFKDIEEKEHKSVRQVLDFDTATQVSFAPDCKSLVFAMKRSNKVELFVCCQLSSAFYRVGTHFSFAKGLLVCKEIMSTIADRAPLTTHHSPWVGPLSFARSYRDHFLALA